MVSSLSRAGSWNVVGIPAGFERLPRLSTTYVIGGFESFVCLLFEEAKGRKEKGM
jgi:hypothetical protein